MTKPKCVGFKVCGDFALSARRLKGAITMKDVSGWSERI